MNTIHTFTDSQKRKIRDEYATTKTTLKQLSIKYNSSIYHINKVIKFNDFIIKDTKLDRRYKLSQTQIKNIIKCLERGDKPKDLAKKYGVNVGNIYRINGIDKPKTNNPRPTQEQLNQMKNLREKGNTLKSISIEMNMDINKVAYYLKRTSTIMDGDLKERIIDKEKCKEYTKNTEKYRQEIKDELLIKNSIQ